MDTATFPGGTGRLPRAPFSFADARSRFSVVTTRGLETVSEWEAKAFSRELFGVLVSRSTSVDSF